MPLTHESKPGFIQARDPVRVLGFLQAGATLNLTMHGKVDPLFFIFTETDMVPVVPDFSTDRAKEESLELARSVAKDLGAWAVALVSEAWFTTVPLGHRLPDRPVRELAERQEGILVILYTSDGLELTQTGVTKDGAGGRKVEWAEPELDTGAGSGRLSGFFPTTHTQAPGQA
jgi:hypothetical protein